LSFFYCLSAIGNNNDNGAQNQTKVSAENTLTIQCSPELYSLTSNWANEYIRLNPSLNLTVTKISDHKSLDGKLLSFISDEYEGKANEKTQWEMVIGHDAIVPVINAKNPLLNEIYRNGISAEKLNRILNNNQAQNWATVVEGSQNMPLINYIYNNDAVIASIAKFIKADPSLIIGFKVATSEEVIAAVQKDIYAIGFCKLNDIRKVNTNEWIDNIKLLPVDKNGNGRIDNFENIYSNPDAFARGVWIGKYPSSLSGNIYAQSSAKPTDKLALDFLTWVLSDGGQLLNSNGYSDLASGERQANINTLISNNTPADQAKSNSWILFLSVIVIILVFLTFLFRILATKKSKFAIDKILITPVLNEDRIAAPKGLYFDKTHTWTFMEKDGLVKIGIDDFLQHLTGTITRIKMKEPGEMVRKGEKILTLIRFGKQLDIYSPITGIVKEQNQAVLTDPHLMNSSTYSEGWVYTVEPKNWLREIQFLFMVDKYKEWLKDEFIRLKDFFSVTVMSNTYAYNQIVLQDGGELNDNILADMGPEVWEDFQTKFLDTSK
jgi:glycine cleavage system H lipoate-binding protein/ABC-type phosphate transport system substrate-binding protein